MIIVEKCIVKSDVATQDAFEKNTVFSKYFKLMVVRSCKMNLK